MGWLEAAGPAIVILLGCVTWACVYLWYRRVPTHDYRCISATAIVAMLYRDRDNLPDWPRALVSEWWDEHGNARRPES